jgi:hypothetical protein
MAANFVSSRYSRSFDQTAWYVVRPFNAKNLNRKWGIGQKLADSERGLCKESQPPRGRLGKVRYVGGCVCLFCFFF